MITSDNFCSISELRDKTSKVVKEAQKTGKKIILSQNKPVWVFLSIDEYNNLRKLWFGSEVASKSDKKAYAQSSHGTDGVDAFELLKSLK